MGAKITDMLVSAIIKKGILWEGRNIDVDVELPSYTVTNEFTDDTKAIKVNIKCEHMSIKVEKGE